MLSFSSFSINYWHMIAAGGVKNHSFWGVPAGIIFCAPVDGITLIYAWVALIVLREFQEKIYMKLGMEQVRR